MASAININFGLDASSFISGVSSVTNQTKSMSATVERQIEALGRQFHQLSGTTDQYERYRAASRGATAAQRQDLETMLQRIAAEKAAQASAKAQQAQQAALIQTQEKAAAAVRSMISDLERENQTFGMTTAEIRLYEMRLNGATQAELARMQVLNRTNQALRIQQANQQAATQAQNQASQAAVRKAEALKNALVAIENERQSIGKTNIELRLHELRQQGATAAQLRRAEASLRAVDADRQQQNALRQTQRQAEQTRGAYTGLIASMKGMVAGYLSIYSVASLMRTVDSYTGLESRLKLVTKSQQDLNQAMSDTRAIALASSMPWESVTTIYQRFAQNADALGLSMAQIARMTETVSKAAVMSGGSMDSVNAALVQLGQGLASGVLRGEEFNSIAEQAPYILNLLAKALGVNIGQLRMMAADGQLTADIVARAMSEMSSTVDAEFGKLGTTGAQAIEQLKTKWTDFLGETNKSSGVMNGFVSVLGVLGDNLDTLAVAGVTVAMTALTKAVFASTVAVKEKIVAVMAERAALVASTQAAAQAAQTERMRAMADLNAAQAAAARAAGTRNQIAAEAALAASQARATAATIAETAATNAATAATSRLAMAKTMLLGALGGPAGLVVTGLAVGSMYYALRDNAADVTNAMNAQSETVAELTERYKGLNREQQLAFKVKALEGVDAQKAALNQLYKQQELARGDYSVINFDGKVYSNPAQIDALNKVLAELRSGAIDGQQALEKLNATQLFDDEKTKQLTIGISKMESLVSSLRRYNEQLDLTNNKTITTTIEEKRKTSTGQGPSVADSVEYEKIRGIADEFQKMHAQLGMTTEELKLAELQQHINNLAAKGAHADVIRAAQLQSQLAERHHIEMKTAKQLDELKKKEAQELEQNNKKLERSREAINSEIEKRNEALSHMGRTQEQITALKLAMKGATDAQIKHAVAIDRVTSKYDKQRKAMETLEDMNKEIARLGKSELEVKLMDFKDKGASQEQLNLYKEQLQYVEKFKESQKLNDASAKQDQKSMESFSTSVSRFGESVNSSALQDLSKMSRWDRKKAEWASIREEENRKNTSLGWYEAHTPESRDSVKNSKKPVSLESKVPAKFTEGVKKLNEEMQTWGVLYLAKDGSPDMAKVLATPENAKMIKELAKMGMREMARDGAASSS